MRKEEKSKQADTIHISITNIWFESMLMSTCEYLTETRQLQAAICAFEISIILAYHCHSHGGIFLSVPF